MCMLLREIEEYSKQQESLLPRYNPEVLIFDTPETVDAFAALRVIEQVRTKPDSILTLPTGNTPIAMYQHIAEGYKQGILDFSRVTIFNLDEYCPIQQAHPNSYAAFMRRHLY